MIVPFLLFLCSLVGVGASLTLSELSDILLVAGPSAIASLLLLIRAYVGRKRPPLNPEGRKHSHGPKLKHIVVDGSNVMHWKDGTPQIETVREVIQILQRRGFAPGVVFDANAGHILTGQYQHNRAMSLLLGLPPDQVMVVTKGTQADDYILTVARGLGVPVVTNDRYRDWAESYPEVNEPGHLIRGRYLDEHLVLDISEVAKTQT